jgi:chaperonin GroEL
LEDIAILTGGEVIAEDRGVTFENAELSVIGSARKVIVTKDETTIVEGSGTATAVKARIEQINKQIGSASSEYDREQLEKRRAALEGKVAVIKVGGATETEIEEKKFRVDDAVAAVKSALDEGVVPGGGVTLLELSKIIKHSNQATILQALQPGGSEIAGAQLLKNALEQPYKILMTNSGVNPEEWLPQILKSSQGLGIDVNSPDKLVNMKDSGIVDPTRVIKEAIQNAVSIAGTAMTMGTLVTDLPEKATPAAPDMGGGMGMM